VPASFGFVGHMWKRDGGASSPGLGPCGLASGSAPGGGEGMGRERREVREKRNGWVGGGGSRVVDGGCKAV